MHGEEGIFLIKWRFVLASFGYQDKVTSNRVKNAVILKTNTATFSSQQCSTLVFLIGDRKHKQKKQITLDLHKNP